MRVRELCLILSVAALGGCRVYGANCGFEIRTLLVEGSAKANPTDSADAHLTMIERRGDESGKELSWELRGGKFRDRLISMTLVDQSGKVIFTFPPPLASLATLSVGHAAESEGANLDGFFDLLASGQAKVVIVLSSEFLGDPAGLTLTLQLQRITRRDWEPLYCA